jgi:ferredoxin
MRIAADRDLCIGAGNCVVRAPAVFDQDADDGLVELLLEEPDGSDAAAARDAVGLCPSGALRILEG